MDTTTPGTDTKRNPEDGPEQNQSPIDPATQRRRDMYALYAIESAIAECRNRRTVIDKDGKPCDINDMFY